MSPAPLPVLFVSPSLQGGGAERHLLRLLQHLDRRRLAPGLALHRSGGVFESQLPADVPQEILQPSRAMPTFWRMLRCVAPLRRHIERRRPAAVCALQNHAGVATLLACRGLPPERRPPVAVGVQNNLSQKFERRGRPLTSRLLAFLMARTYPQAQRVVAASQGVADDLRRRFPDLGERLDVIYNAGFDDRAPGSDTARQAATAATAAPPDAPLIVACGRLIEQKGFDLLLHALHRLASTPSAAPPPHAWILGEGPLRGRLERLTERLGLRERVRWLGFQDDPQRWMAQADVFVLSSRWEGFGNVLVEAMACGTPTVAFDCPHGPREILDDGHAGRLVPMAASETLRSEALAKAIGQLLEQPSTARELAARGKERARLFSPQRSARHYGDLLIRLAEAAK